MSSSRALQMKKGCNDNSLGVSTGQMNKRMTAREAWNLVYAAFSSAVDPNVVKLTPKQKLQKESEVTQLFLERYGDQLLCPNPREFCKDRNGNIYIEDETGTFLFNDKTYTKLDKSNTLLLTDTNPPTP